MSTPDLTPFAKQEQAARQQFARHSVSNQFNKNKAATYGQRSLDDYTRGFDRSMPSFTAGFGQRGLSGGGIKSGVMQRAMQQRVGDYTRQYGRMQEDVYDQQQGYAQQGQQYQADLNVALANIEAQKAATIAGTAQHLTALRPYYGG